MKKLTKWKDSLLDSTPLWLREPFNPRPKDKHGNRLKKGEELTPSGNVQKPLF